MRQLHGQSKGHAARDDCDFMERIGMLNKGCHQGVSAFMERRHALFLVA